MTHEAAEDRGLAPVALYFGPLTFLIYLVNPINQLLDYATSFMLKDQLHASATQTSVFRLVIGLPVYVAVVFGLTRDLWSPLGRRDRGYLILFGGLTAAILAWLSMVQLSYGTLLLGMFAAMLSFRFVNAAYMGLMALVGQEKLMTGRVAAIWNGVQYVPLIIGALAGGWVAEHLSARLTFQIVAALTLLIAIFALWKPAAIFSGVYDRPEARGSDLIGDIRRLLRHKAIYAPVLILFLFQFSPGANTPLQYYLSNHLHASDQVYAGYNAIFLAAFLPASVGYLWLCRRFTLRTLLLVGTVMTIPQMIPLALIHSPMQALLVAAPIGLLGSLAAPAYYDLTIRACPPGLQGALMMLVDGAFFLSYRASDLLGSAIYNADPRYGFVWCVALTTGVYALILPALWLAPKALVNTREGEISAAIVAERDAELASA